MRTTVLSGLLAVSLMALGCSGGTPPAASAESGAEDAPSEGGEASPTEGGGDEGAASSACEGLDQKKCGITMGCAWSMDTPAVEAGDDEAAEPAAPSGSCVNEKPGAM